MLHDEEQMFIHHAIAFLLKYKPKRNGNVSETFSTEAKLESMSLLNISESYLLNRTYSFNKHADRSQSLLFVFETVRISAAFCSVLGILGNLSLTFVISKTSFRHVSYGLLIITIALFDSIRLLSAIFYYFLFSKIIPLNLVTESIYLGFDRYPIFVINWCKVLMSIERLLTVRYWEHHTHLDWRSKHKRKQHRRFVYSIVFILIAGLLTQHPNFIIKRYQSVYINYKYLMLILEKNKYFAYGSHRFNDVIFTIISHLIFDTTMPIISVLILNIFLLREIRKLPLSLQVKVRESVGILLFLTALSIAIVPRAFIAFYTYYSINKNSDLLNKITTIFYICLGFEYFNHAITGYACFLSSALLRSELKNLIWTRYIVPHIH